MRRRVGTRKIEFIGWASKPLLDFLEAIGEDKDRKLHPEDVVLHINKYIKDKNLVCADQKTKVISDDLLRALFGKKFFNRKKVYILLKPHFTDNHDESDSEEDEHSTQRISIRQSEKVLGPAPRSRFAAITSENIKLVYLKKTFLQEMVKFQDFESKVVGSFVRMRTDPNDIFERRLFRLGQVTGLEKVSGLDTELNVQV